MENPEIIFLDHAQPGDEGAVLYIFARFEVEEGKALYAKFKIRPSLYYHASLKVPSRFSSYAGWVQEFEKAIENGCQLLEADYSELVYNQDAINATITPIFAKTLSDVFVDVELNCVRTVLTNHNTSYYYEYSGFGYDEKGKSYAFRVCLKPQDPWNTMDLTPKLISGELDRTDLVQHDVYMKEIGSYFVPEAEQVAE